MKNLAFLWVSCALLALPACLGEKVSAPTDATLVNFSVATPVAKADCCADADAASAKECEESDGAMEGCESMKAGAMEGCESMKAGSMEGCESMKAGAMEGCADMKGAQPAGMEGCSGEKVCDSQVMAMVDQAEVEVTTAAAAAPLPAPADETAYGADLTLTTITPISALMADWDSYEGKTVQVRGTVVGVCAHRGCWMDIAGTEDFQKLRFKVNDGDMVFPITDKGRTATAEGVVQKMVISVEQLREAYAARAEAAGEDFDPVSITEPKIVWQLKGTGARIGA